MIDQSFVMTLTTGGDQNPRSLGLCYRKGGQFFLCASIENCCHDTAGSGKGVG